MTVFLTALLTLFLVVPCWGAGLGTPSLSPPLATARFFDPDRLLTTGGVRYDATSELSLEPELGVGYRASERDLPGRGAEEIHRLHAQAGWRLSLADTIYLSAAAKLALYTYQSEGSYGGQELRSRQAYEFVRTFRDLPTWTGEVGLHLANRTDLTLYYDQGVLTGGLPGTMQQEERIGTRIIWRFK